MTTGARQGQAATTAARSDGKSRWEDEVEFLQRVTLDAELAAAVRRDYRTADLSEADRAMLDYVAQLTHDATSVTPGDLDRLRQFGFDERAILQINLIASWFNYINRVADGLGVGRTPRT